jgi:hypothetical protein
LTGLTLSFLGHVLSFFNGMQLNESLFKARDSAIELHHSENLAAERKDVLNSDVAQAFARLQRIQKRLKYFIGLQSLAVISLLVGLLLPMLNPSFVAICPRS